MVLDETETSQRIVGPNVLLILVRTDGGERGQIRVTEGGELSIHGTGMDVERKFLIIVIKGRLYIPLGDPKVRYFRRR